MKSLCFEISQTLLAWTIMICLISGALMLALVGLPFAAVRWCLDHRTMSHR